MKSVSKNALVNELLENLGHLFGMRVAEYHRNHVNQIDFFNQFTLVVPEELTYETDYLIELSQFRNHFLTNLGVEIFDLEFDAISLSQSKGIQYYFTIDLEVPGVSDDCVFIQFRLVDKQVFVDLPQSIADLEAISDEELRALIQKLKHEITFGSLKR